MLCCYECKTKIMSIIDQCNVNLFCISPHHRLFVGCHIEVGITQSSFPNLLSQYVPLTPPPTLAYYSSPWMWPLLLLKGPILRGFSSICSLQSVQQQFLWLRQATIDFCHCWFFDVFDVWWYWVPLTLGFTHYFPVFQSIASQSQHRWPRIYWLSHSSGPHRGLFIKSILWNCCKWSVTSQICIVGCDWGVVFPLLKLVLVDWRMGKLEITWDFRRIH